DPGLFQWAMERAGVVPGECVMVGDRHDNDVVPAAALGLHTIWVRWQSLAGKGSDPSEPLARAYIETHQRVPFYGRVTQPDIEPSGTVHGLGSVAAAIERLEARMPC